MIDSVDTILFSRRFNLWYTRSVSQVSGWAKRTCIFYHRYNLIVDWLVHWVFQKYFWAFGYLQWFFCCKAFQEISTYQYIYSEVRQGLFRQLNKLTARQFDTYIGLTLVPRVRILRLLHGIKPNHLNTFVWCMIPKICRLFIWCWFWFVVCSLNVVFKLNSIVFILKSHSRCVF